MFLSCYIISLPWASKGWKTWNSTKYSKEASVHRNRLIGDSWLRYIVEWTKDINGPARKMHGHQEAVTFIIILILRYNNNPNGVSTLELLILAGIAFWWLASLRLPGSWFALRSHSLAWLPETTRTVISSQATAAFEHSTTFLYYVERLLLR